MMSYCYVEVATVRFMTSNLDYIETIQYRLM